MPKKNKLLTRRIFLKTAAGAASLLLVNKSGMLYPGDAKEAKPPKASYWKDNLFVQTNVDMKKYADGILRVRIGDAEGVALAGNCRVNPGEQWLDYKICALSNEFMEWKRECHIQTAQGNKYTLEGAHNAAVASYGSLRNDGLFTINNAYKGIGMAPRKDRIKKIIAQLEEVLKKERNKRLEFLENYYRDNQNFDPTKLISLELYSTAEFETHTFLNIMSIPLVSLVFLDIPSYEIKSVCRLVHPADKTASEEERDLLKYTNMIHNLFHGPFSKDFTVMIFHTCELFDNSPSRGKGKKVLPD